MSDRMFGQGFYPVSHKDAAKAMYTFATSGTYSSTAFNAGTTVAYGSKVFDTAEAFSTTTYKFTAPSSGIFMIIAAIDINIASTLTLYQNSTAVAANDAAASVDNKLIAIRSAAANDTFFIKVSGASATATFAKANTKNYFAIFKLA